MSAHKSVDNLQNLSCATPTLRAHVLKVEFNCNSVPVTSQLPTWIALCMGVCVCVWECIWSVFGSVSNWVVITVGDSAV